MMVVALNPEIEKVVKDQAERTGKTPEEVVNDALRRGLLPNNPPESPAPRDDWEKLLASIPVHTGVSLTDEQVSSESIYED
jgi:hypothetical protein